jgi:hypothetical protein
MKQISRISFLTLLLLSCHQSSVAPRFHFARVSLVSYFWSTRPFITGRGMTYRVSSIDSSTTLVFTRVVQVDSTGRCMLALANEFGGPFLYSDSVLSSDVDSVLTPLESMRLDTVHLVQKGHAVWYDGPVLCICLEASDHARTRLKYIPDLLPRPLSRIHALLNGISSTRHIDSISSFNFLAIAESLGVNDSAWVNGIKRHSTGGVPVPVPDQELHWRSKHR